MNSDILKHINDFKRYLQVEKNASQHTLRNYLSDLKQFCDYLVEKGFAVKAVDGEIIIEIEKIDRLILRGYLAQLSLEQLSKKSIARKLSSIRGLFNYLMKSGIINSNPSKALITPKQPRRIPKYLSIDEVLHLLRSIKGKGFAGARNLAIVELFYASGIRVSELNGIDIEDLDLSGKKILIHGKRKKERWVFINDYTVNIVDSYLNERSELLRLLIAKGKSDNINSKALILNQSGGRLTTRSIARIIDKVALLAGIPKHVTPHILRHTFATHLLDNGADLLAISKLLGHSNLSSTQIYTHLSTQKLLEIYDSAHPKAKRQE